MAHICELLSIDTDYTRNIQIFEILILGIIIWEYKYMVNIICTS